MVIPPKICQWKRSSTHSSNIKWWTLLIIHLYPWASIFSFQSNNNSKKCKPTASNNLSRFRKWWFRCKSLSSGPSIMFRLRLTRSRKRLIRTIRRTLTTLRIFHTVLRSRTIIPKWETIWSKILTHLKSTSTAPTYSIVKMAQTVPRSPFAAKMTRAL